MFEELKASMEAQFRPVERILAANRRQLMDSLNKIDRQLEEIRVEQDLIWEILQRRHDSSTK